MNRLHKTLVENAKAVSHELVCQIDGFAPELLNRFPVKYYCDCLKTYPTVGTYKYVSKEILNLSYEIVEQSNKATLEIYHKLIVITLLIESSFQIETNILPEEVKKWYRIHFDTILKKIENNSIHKGSYLFPEDRLFKDLGICTMKLIPAGVRKIHMEKLPVKRFLIQNGIKQFLRGFFCIFCELKGIQPVFHGHLDSRDRQSIAEFSPEGWIRHFMMVADLLKTYKNVKGVIGLTWFYDPKLNQISPELAYLREMIIDNGGKFFIVGSNKNTIENAIRMSPKRRKLYQSGEYLPTSYLYIWPRKRIIQWAEKV